MGGGTAGLGRTTRRGLVGKTRAAAKQATPVRPETLVERHEELGFPIERVIRDWQTGYTSLNDEMEVALDVEGRLPDEVKGGVLYRNGPGVLERGGKTLNQPFDGDGMILRFAFDNQEDTVRFSNKFVRTQGYVDEVEAGRFIYKSAFSTGNPSGAIFFNPFDFSTKNVANTHVAELGGKLLALWEGGLPHVLDKDTLETLEKESRWVDGSIDDPFAAHYRLTEAPRGQEGRRLVNFGAKAGPGQADITFYEYTEAGKCVSKKKFEVPGAGFGFFHDMAVTPNYYILFENPCEINGRALLTEYVFGQRSLAGCLEYVGGPGKPAHLLVFPRTQHESAGYKRIPVDPCFVFHHAAAFERDGMLVLDSVQWREFDFTATVDEIPPSTYVGGMRSELGRIELDPTGATSTATRRRVSDRCCEFPCVHPAYQGVKEHRFIYAACSPLSHPVLWSPNQGICRFDMKTGEESVWLAGERRFTAEPVFVPSAMPGAPEEAGYLLVMVHDAGAPASDGRTSLVVLDAQRLEDGPIATVPLPVTVPFGLHGTFVPARV